MGKTAFSLVLSIFKSDLGYGLDTDQTLRASAIWATLSPEVAQFVKGLDYDQLESLCIGNEDEREAAPAELQDVLDRIFSLYEEEE